MSTLSQPRRKMPRTASWHVQEAGFTASAAGLVGSCMFAIATGLLLAEVNISTIYKQGAGEVSIVSMASQTLGSTGTQVTSAAYLFLHYSLLVAYIAKAGEITAETLQLPTPAGAALFASLFAAACYGTSSKLLDQVNGALVVAVVASFLVSVDCLPFSSRRRSPRQ